MNNHVKLSYHTKLNYLSLVSFLSFNLLSLTLLSGFVLSSSLSSAIDDSVVDDIAITVPISCTLSGTGMNTHTATINPGTYQADIGTTTLKAICNDNGGFSIYAIGYTGEVYGTTTLIGASTNQTIATGTATSGATSNWAMKLDTISSPTPTYPITIQSDTNGSFSNYHIVPTTYTKVAERQSGTDIGSSAEGSTLTTTYATYISSTQTADTYNGKVKYTMVHPYDANAPVICNSNATTISEAKCLQDFAHVTETNRNSIIASMTPETQYTLKDSRDGKTYTIAKYQVGNSGNYDVWMTQNLDLDLSSNTTYTNLNTDIGYNTTTNSYDTAAWSPVRSTYQSTSTHIHEWCTGGTWNSQYSYCEDNDTPESYDPGNLYWNATESDYSDWDEYYNSCDYSTPTPVCDQSLNPISTYVSSTGTTQYHLGNYYNWAAALATNDSSQFDSSSIVEQSICPAGWTLPRTGDGEDSFYSLWNQYGFSESSINGNNKLWTSPLYFAASGSFGGALGGVGGDGGFWSPIPDGSGDAGYAYFGIDGDSYPSDSGSQYYGYSVRCIARPVISSDSGGGGGGPKGPSV